MGLKQNLKSGGRDFVKTKIIIKACANIAHAFIFITNS